MCFLKKVDGINNTQRAFRVDNYISTGLMRISWECHRDFIGDMYYPLIVYWAEFIEYHHQIWNITSYNHLMGI